MKNKQMFNKWNQGQLLMKNAQNAGILKHIIPLDKCVVPMKVKQFSTSVVIVVIDIKRIHE